MNACFGGLRWALLTSFCLAPHRQVFTTIWRHDPQTPLWQRSAQTCSPQDSVLPQVSPQVGVARVQGSLWVLLPQGQRLSSLRGQGGQDPEWQTTSHM